MWKNIFAASLLASVSSVLFFGSQSASAAIAAPIPYNPGDWTGNYSGNITVCASGSDYYDLSETPITADIQAENLSTQLVFDGSKSCRRFENMNHFQIRYFSPIGVHGDLLIEGSALNGESNIAVTVARNEPVDEYFWMASSSRQSFEGVSTVISFDANGGTGTLPEIADVTIGSSVTLPRNTLTREGYRFAGWNTKADGTGTPYSDGGKFQVTPQMIANGPVELYAQWQGRAVLDYGPDVNVKLKELAGTNTGSSYYTIDSNIRAIRSASALPEGFDVSDTANIISANEVVSPEPIYAWFDNNDYDDDGAGDGVIYLYTSADVIEGGKSMLGMLSFMNSLADISALASWDTSGASNMNDLFRNAVSLADISALASWDTSGVTYMGAMFHGDTLLSDITALSFWNTSSVTDMGAIFGYTAITTADALETKQHEGKDYVSWDISNVKSINHMFYMATSLTDISALASWDTSSVTSMAYMFRATSLASTSALASWDTSNVTDMASMFLDVSSLTDVSDLSSWNTSSLEDMSYMFYNTKIADTDALETKQHEGKDYVSWDISNVKSINHMFRGATSLTDISALASWDTSSVTAMTGVFYGATSLTDISALASWNTTSVIDMAGMFENTSITNVDALETKQYEGKDYVSWDISNVNSVSYMFYGTTSLTDISALASWNTSNVTNMKSVFYNAVSLMNPSAIEGWDTSNVTNMSLMFYGVPARPLPTWYHE